MPSAGYAHARSVSEPRPFARQPIAPRRIHLGILAIIWTAFVIYGSLVPLVFHPMPLAEALARFRSMPLPRIGLSMGVDWATNVLLFIPLTFLWLGALGADRRQPARLLAAVALIPLAFALSVGVEFAQTWFRRTPSSYDIAAETLGGIAGVTLYLLVGNRTVWWLRQFSSARESRSQVEWLLLTYGIGLIVYSLMPLDLTLNPVDLYHKYRSGQVLLVPFAYHYQDAATQIYQSFADVMEFVPIGAWMVLSQRRRWPERTPIVIGAIGGALLAGLIEFGQLLVLSRFTDVTDIFLGGVGGAMGGWLAGHGIAAHPANSPGTDDWTRRGRALGMAAGVFFYSVFLMAGFWFPFEMTRDTTVIHRRLDLFFAAPFTALYWTDDLNALRQMLLRVLLFAPLGVLFAYGRALAVSRTLRAALAAAALLYCATLAFGIEAAEIVMPSKVADFTEVLLCIVGAVGGLMIGARLFRRKAAST